MVRQELWVNVRPGQMVDANLIFILVFVLLSFSSIGIHLVVSSYALFI